VNRVLMKPCPYEGNAESQKDCEHYEPRKDTPKHPDDWVCLYYRRINGSEPIHWCDGMYDKTG